MSVKEKIEQYYDDKIKPLFKGYVNDKHKNDCVENALELYRAMKRENITYSQISSLSGDDDVYEHFYEKYITKIPLYLEALTGDYSMEIASQREDALIKFLISQY